MNVKTYVVLPEPDARSRVQRTWYPSEVAPETKATAIAIRWIQGSTPSSLAAAPSSGSEPATGDGYGSSHRSTLPAFGSGGRDICDRGTGHRHIGLRRPCLVTPATVDRQRRQARRGRARRPDDQGEGQAHELDEQQAGDERANDGADRVRRIEHAE